MEPEEDAGDLWDLLRMLSTGQRSAELHSPQEEEEPLSYSHILEVEAGPVLEKLTVTPSDSVPHAPSNTPAQPASATAPHALDAILKNPVLLAKLVEIVAAAQAQPAQPQALVPVVAPTPVQLLDCPDCGKSFKSTQGLGSHRNHCKPTPRAPVLQCAKRTRAESSVEEAQGTATRNHSFANERGLVMHISCVEGQTFQVGLFERHWQWTASISDDRLQFYTEHHLSGPSGSDVFEQVKKMCMMDAVKAFPGQHINFTTSEKRRELSPWRPLEDAAKQVVRDNAVTFLTEAFKKVVELQVRK